MTSWARSLTPAQRDACTRIMNRRSDGSHHAGLRHGFRVFMTPTLGPPQHVELRLYDISGRLIRTWVIDAGEGVNDG
jgi:hypothetical protein